jgi:hypothetical protein
MHAHKYPHTRLFPKKIESIECQLRFGSVLTAILQCRYMIYLSRCVERLEGPSALRAITAGAYALQIYCVYLSHSVEQLENSSYDRCQFGSTDMVYLSRFVTTWKLFVHLNGTRRAID